MKSMSHRARLAAASAGAAALVLALLFAAVVALVRASADREKREELSSALAAALASGDPRFDVAEFREAHPEIAVSLDEGVRESAAFRRSGERLSLTASYRGQSVTLTTGLRETERRVSELALVLAALLLPLALLVGGATWLAARSVFRPLARLSAQALAMSGGDLSERLATDDRAEFGAFARDLNLMLDRVEATARREERFAEDAAHEFRTPLAILRSRLETALLRRRDPEEYEAVLRRSVGEIERLGAMTEALLRSARGSVAPAPPIPLTPLVGEAVARWAERYGREGIALVAAPGPEGLAIGLLPEEVGVLLDNLLSNALRYAPSGSEVRIEAAREEEGAGHRVAVGVTDAGPGIAPELGEAIFARFVRDDEARDRASGGAGIGLSVCRQIVAARGGVMTLTSRETGGVTIGFRLPAHPRVLREACHTRRDPRR